MKSLTAFKGVRKLAAGVPSVVAVQVKVAMENDPTSAILVFRDDNGEQFDLDLRGSLSDIEDRYKLDAKPRLGRGRPKLGVVAREITLLPRHWEWLGKQPGGASVALRKLVEANIKESGENYATRDSRESCYRFASALAGNMPNFEEACRALYAGDQKTFREMISTWPMDVQAYALYLSWDTWVRP